MQLFRDKLGPFSISIQRIVPSRCPDANVDYIHCHPYAEKSSNSPNLWHITTAGFSDFANPHKQWFCKTVLPCSCKISGASSFRQILCVAASTCHHKLRCKCIPERVKGYTPQTSLLHNFSQACVNTILNTSFSVTWEMC